MGIYYTFNANNITLQATATIAELTKLTGQTPYHKSLKVKVVAKDDITQYKNANNEEKSLLNTAIADGTHAIKCVVYDKAKFGRFIVGQMLILRNVIRKEGLISVTTNTKVFPAQGVVVPPQIEEAGKHLLHPPAAAVSPIKEALTTPPKVRVSIRGKIVQVCTLGRIIIIVHMFVPDL